MKTQHADVLLGSQYRIEAKPYRRLQIITISSFDTNNNTSFTLLVLVQPRNKPSTAITSK